MFARYVCQLPGRSALLAITAGCLAAVAGCSRESADPAIARLEVKVEVAGAAEAAFDEEQLIREAERQLHEALALWEHDMPDAVRAAERPDLKHVNSAEHEYALLEYSLSSPVVVDVPTERENFVGVQFYVTARLRSRERGTSSQRRFAYRVYQVSPRRWIAGGWTL